MTATSVEEFIFTEIPIACEATCDPAATYVSTETLCPHPAEYWVRALPCGCARMLCKPHLDRIIRLRRIGYQVLVCSKCDVEVTDSRIVKL